MKFEELFHLVWRNQYINSCIRNNKFRNTTIKVDCDYLNENHRYLSLLDTENYDIRIKLDLDHDHVKNYLDHPYRHVINSLEARQLDSSIQDLWTPLTDFGDRLVELYLTISHLDQKIIEEGLCIPSLPRGLRKLSMVSSCINVDHSFIYLKGVPLCGLSGLRELSLRGIEFPDESLPNTLTSLSLYTEWKIPKVFPKHLKRFSVNSKVVDLEYTIPDSISDFKVSTDTISMSNFKPPPNRVYKDASVSISTPEEFSQLQHLPWVSKVNFYIHNTFTLDCNFTNITSMVIGIFGPLSIKSLPPFLEYFCTVAKEKFFKKDTFPSSLKRLVLPNYNSPIQVGELPLSLTELSLPSYTVPIVDQIIPSNVQILTVGNLFGTEPNVLPNSITDLRLNRCSDAIEQDVIPISVVKLTMDIRNWFEPTSVFPSSITDLTINLSLGGYGGYHSLKSLFDKLPIVKYLKLSNVLLEKDIVPDGCQFLQTDFTKPIQDDTIPQSIKTLSLTKDIYKSHYVGKYHVPPQIDLLITNFTMFESNRPITIKMNGILTYQHLN